MSEIVVIHNGQAVTTTLVIAEGTGYDHASVIKLVRKYSEDLIEFGLLDFKSESSGGRPTEYADLNQEQSALLMTYLRNNDVVREFKKALITEISYSADVQNKNPVATNRGRYANPWDAVKKHAKAEDLVKREALTAGGKQRKNFINERGMWRLVMKSEPSTRTVSDWSKWRIFTS